MLAIITKAISQGPERGGQLGEIFANSYGLQVAAHLGSISSGSCNLAGLPISLRVAETTVELVAQTVLPVAM